MAKTRITITLDPDLLATIDARGSDTSGRIAADLSTFYALLGEAQAGLAEGFTEAEQRLLVRLDLPTYLDKERRQGALLIAADCQRPPIPPALLGKLVRLGPLEYIALVDWVSRLPDYTAPAPAAQPRSVPKGV